MKVTIELSAEAWERVLSAGDCGFLSLDTEWQRPTIEALTELDKQLRAALKDGERDG